jgi:hypothetical protein
MRKKNLILLCLVGFVFYSHGQNEKKSDNSGSCISTRVTVPKQTQGTTFGEKMNSGTNRVKTRIESVSTYKQPYLVEVFSSGERDPRNKAIVNSLTVSGSIVSSGGGAATASYASTGMVVSNAKVKITISQPETGDEASTFTDEKGNFSLTLSRDTLHTIYVNGVEYGQVKLIKTKHDTVKNSINNVR